MKQDAKKILKIILTSLLFLFIVIYTFFVSKDLIFGVKIKNVAVNGLPMQSDEKVTDSVMNVTGVAKNAISLTLNGRDISIDQQGNFNETIVLLPGYNVIDIKAKDKFGHSDEKNYKLIY